MAQRATIGGVSVKIRHPWGVFFLTLLTFGVYYIVWYYKINKELNAYGDDFPLPTNPLEVSPGVATVAITIGSLIIVPPFVSMWRTFARIGRAEELAGLEDDRANPGLGFLLYLVAVIFLPFELVYAQSHLNRVWRQEIGEESLRDTPRAAD